MPRSHMLKIFPIYKTIYFINCWKPTNFVANVKNTYCMNRKFILPSLAALTMIFHTSVQAQEETGFSENLEVGYKKKYWSTAMEGNILGTAMMERPGTEAKLSTLRYTAFLHLGGVYHYNFNNQVGIATGLHVRNVGFIEKYSQQDSTVKRRIYALGVPVMLKFGNFTNDKYFFVGGDANVAIHFKEKGFVKRSDKTKNSEWFSERTPIFHPSVFLGYNANVMYLKLNYYPSNFLNTDYVDNTGVKPYAGYKVNLITLTVGFNISYKPKFD